MISYVCLRHQRSILGCFGIVTNSASCNQVAGVGAGGDGTGAGDGPSVDDPARQSNTFVGDPPRGHWPLLLWLWNAVNLKRYKGLSPLCIQDSLMEIWWSWRAWEWRGCITRRTTLISCLCAQQHDQNFVAWEPAFSNTTRLKVLQ